MAWTRTARRRASALLALAWAGAVGALALGAAGILSGGTPLGALAGAWGAHAALATAGLVDRPWMRDGA